ncbi:MAG: Nramp family divalent metal transporter, partial [Verrucomicrobiota bacterium]
GAGAIMASVTIGSGETIFAARGGAIFGYTLLWCFVAGAFMKGVQVYASTRTMTLTGEHPMTQWTAFPGPKNWIPLALGLLSIICFPFWMAALPLALGDMANWIFGMEGTPEQMKTYARLWGTANIVLVVVLTLFHSYGFLERAQTLIIGLLLLCILAAVFAARPDWLAALAGLVTPRVPAYQPWILEAYRESIAQRPPWVEVVTYLGAIGGGTYDYIGYVGCYREKGWGALAWKKKAPYEVNLPKEDETPPIDPSPENMKRGRLWLRAPMIDTWTGFLAVLVFTVCFMVLGAAILFPQQLVPEGNELLTHQASFLTNMHPGLLYVYQLGAFFAVWGTVYGAYEVYLRTAFECLAPISSRVRRLPYRRFRVGILAYIAFFSLIFLWTFDDPIALVTPASIVGGVFACGLWCFLMFWTDRRFVPAPLRMGKGLTFFLLLSGLIMTLMGGKAILDYLLKLLS